MLNTKPVEHAPLEHVYVQPAQLRVGLYIYLDLGWMDHPFSVSSFKITDDKQIATLRALGLKQIRYDPKRSTVEPLTAQKIVEFARHDSSRIKEENLVEIPSLSPQQIKQKLLKQALSESEQRFLKASQQCRDIQKIASTHTDQAYATANALVKELMSSILTESDIAIHAVQGKRTGDQHYQHELNTLVLCMMLAKNAAVTDEEMEILGTAALLHDIGKKQISDKILLKKEPLTAMESNIFQTHVALGLGMLSDLPIDKRLLSIISQHHEFADGSGYPQGLKDTHIHALAHILIVVNMYENLCNPTNPNHAKSPYEALSYMFAQQRQLFNEHILRRFIKCLGIYPPGSVIRLSDQRLATVISTNPQQPLRPYVQIMLNDADEGEELIIDMREELDVNIVECIKAEQLPVILESAARRKQRMSYFLDKALAA